MLEPVELSYMEWIELDDEICYYGKNDQGRDVCFYVGDAKNDESVQWWSTTMKAVFSCPFCSDMVGAFDDDDIAPAKHWMGKHLAVYHEIAVEKFLLKDDQKKEYTLEKVRALL